MNNIVGAVWNDLHLKSLGITMSPGSHLPQNTSSLAQYVVLSRYFMHTNMSSPATSHIY